MTNLLKPARAARAMTLMEVLIVVSLVSLVSISLYASLMNGVRVWEKSRETVVEQDVVISLDKMDRDLHNAFFHSVIGLEGSEHRFAFPALVRVPADSHSSFVLGEYVDQPGQIEYSFDLLKKGLYRREANYSQALKGTFGTEQLLVRSVKNIHFRYYYLTEEGEVSSQDVLEFLPSGVEVTIEFEDSKGRRTMSKYMEIPVGL